MSSLTVGSSRLAAAALLVMLLVAGPKPASGEETSSRFESAHAAGNRALVFSVQPDFTLGDFESSGLSFKIHRSPETAWRFGLSLSGDRSHEEIARRITQDSILAVTSGNGHGNSFQCQITALMLRYSNPQRRLSPYVGFGPALKLSWRHSEIDLDTTETVDPSESAVERLDQDSQGVFLNGLAGLEWLFHPRLGLHVECGLSGGWTWEHHDDRATTRAGVPPGSPRTVRQKSDSNGWSLQPISTRLGVSAYF